MDGWTDALIWPARASAPGYCSNPEGLPFPGKHISSCSDSPSAPWPVGISTPEGVFQEVGMWDRKASMAPRWPPPDSSDLRALLVSTSCKVPPTPCRGAAEQKSPVKRDIKLERNVTRRLQAGSIFWWTQWPWAWACYQQTSFPLKGPKSDGCPEAGAPEPGVSRPLRERPIPRGVGPPPRICLLRARGLRLSARRPFYFSEERNVP